MPRVPKTFLDKMAKKIRTEITADEGIREFKSMWPGPFSTAPAISKEFVDESGRKVDYNFIKDRYGKPTKKNAAKYFIERRRMEPIEAEEEWELYDLGRKPFLTR